MIKSIFHKKPALLASMVAMTMMGTTPGTTSYFIGASSVRYKGMKSLPGTQKKREKRKAQTLARKRNR